MRTSYKKYEISPWNMQRLCASCLLNSVRVASASFSRMTTTASAMEIARMAQEGSSSSLSPPRLVCVAFYFFLEAGHRFRHRSLSPYVIVQAWAARRTARTTRAATQTRRSRQASLGAASLTIFRALPKRMLCPSFCSSSVVSMLACTSAFSAAT